MPSAQPLQGPPSYAGSGMTTVKQQQDAGSVALLDRLRKLGGEGRKRLDDMDEEKKDASPRGASVSPIRTRPYSPDETVVLNSNTLQPNTMPLDARLVMGLPPKEQMVAETMRSRPPSQERVSSPDIRPTAENVSKYKALQSHASPTTQQVPLTHSQLLESLKKKHEFDDILADIVPNDVKIQRQRGRLRTREDKRRRRRETLGQSSPPALFAGEEPVL
ncbi:hypothetical protein TrRE_jg8749 [Triparma retinervis]|uniref:Uncharacterized protein n=1 Tax=Triparma retinervis TaxID=2557542 RepID=A0A9W7E9J8_9STRA|nr:hypothetical protein TrRE_jg8749 [Triparma retinervis]